LESRRSWKKVLKEKRDQGVHAVAPEVKRSRKLRQSARIKVVRFRNINRVEKVDQKSEKSVVGGKKEEGKLNARKRKDCKYHWIWINRR
jgi:hypothetical protein